MGAKKRKITKQQEQYLINKFMGTHGGLTPRNIEVELNDGYEFAIHQFGGLTIKKKQ